MKGFSFKVSVFILTPITLVAFFAISSLNPESYAQSGDFANNNTSSLTNQTLVGENNWTTYNNEVLGISFDYPSGWEVKEKQNRFDSAPDVTVSNNDTALIVAKVVDRPEDNPLKSSDAAVIARDIEDGVVKDDKMMVIEPTDVKKYKVGGEMTATFLAKFDNGIHQYGFQNLFIKHNGDEYLLKFQDPTPTFDSPETQNIMNRIFHSFKFLG